MRTEEWYRSFADRDVRPYSPSYRRLALGVAGDPELLALLDGLPGPKRQPNLLFGAVRFLGGPVAGFPEFRDWVRGHWEELAATMLRRRTQTNEAGRCAALLPVLASLPQPLALLEVGASAGLCLFPDRYHYRYGDAEVGPPESPVRIDCAIDGPVPVPAQVPSVAWRAGIDLNPLDVADADDLRWLTALVWPEQRAEFRELVAGLPGHWLSNEGLAVFPDLADAVPPPLDGMQAGVLALDGRPLAVSAPHGQYLRWLDH